MSVTEDAIARVPLFSGLSGKDRKSLASSMRERTFQAGVVITEAGKEGIGFFIIAAGTATVSVAGQVRRQLGPGDYFGEIALIDEGTRTAEVKADTDLQCFALTSWEFRPLVRDRPELAWQLMESLVRRIRELEGRLGG